MSETTETETEITDEDQKELNDHQVRLLKEIIVEHIRQSDMTQEQREVEAHEAGLRFIGVENMRGALRVAYAITEVLLLPIGDATKTLDMITGVVHSVFAMSEEIGLIVDQKENKDWTPEDVKRVVVTTRPDLGGYV